MKEKEIECCDRWWCKETDKYKFRCWISV